MSFTLEDARTSASPSAPQPRPTRATRRSCIAARRRAMRQEARRGSDRGRDRRRRRQPRRARRPKPATCSITCWSCCGRRRAARRRHGRAREPHRPVRARRKGRSRRREPSDGASRSSNSQPYHRFTKAEWSNFRADEPMTLDADDIDRLRALTDPISFEEAEEIYLPLSRLISLYVEATQQLHRASTRFLGADDRKVPYIIGVAGSVAVGQIHHLAHPPRAAAALAELAQGRSRHHRRLPASQRASSKSVKLIGPQGLSRKLRSRRASSSSSSDIKSGKPNVGVPVYSHLVYDVVAGRADRHRPPRHPDRRGPQHPAAGRTAEDPASRSSSPPTSSISRSSSMPSEADLTRLVHGALPPPARQPPSPTRRASSTASAEMSAEGSRRFRPLGLDAKSTSPTCATTSSPPAAAPTWSSPRARATRIERCALRKV